MGRNYKKVKRYGRVLNKIISFARRAWFCIAQLTMNSAPPACASASLVYAPLRSVLDVCHWHTAPSVSDGRIWVSPGDDQPWLYRRGKGFGQRGNRRRRSGFPGGMKTAHHSLLSSMSQSTEKGPPDLAFILSNNSARSAALLPGSSRASSAQ